MKLNDGLVRSLNLSGLVSGGCATVDGEKRREAQEFTFRIVGSSVIPIPGAVAFGSRLSSDNTLELEGGMDVLASNAYVTFFLKHFWWNDFYTNSCISSYGGLGGGGFSDIRPGLHLAFGQEFYRKGRFFSGLEYASADFNPLTRDPLKATILRYYLGWGF